QVMKDSVILSLEDPADFSMEDSLIMSVEDSVVFADMAQYSVMVDVFTFREDNVPQYLIDNKREDRRKLTLLFNREVQDTVILEPLSFSPPENWYLLEEHTMLDTIDYWIRDSLFYQLDSMLILTHYHITDTLLNKIPFEDSLRFNYREKKQTTRRRKKDVEQEEEKLTLGLNVQNGKRFDFYKDIIVTPVHPVFTADTSKIQISYMEDTLVMPARITVARDSTRLRRYSIHSEWIADHRYTMNLYPGAFSDIYGLTNDTISMRFSIQNPEYYGKILLNLTGVDGPKIIQVMDEKDVVVQVMVTENDGLVEFPYLEPVTFKLKLIHDSNGNGTWDTGDYMIGRQPERVEFHKESVIIKSNFYYEVNWHLED
ncbi:MAG: hypothetical protein KAJ10_01635, partial [Thermodesulfovibrionia bacterium]|nr:hypothetical protein [Thermodesulfovibrionia bacterium]